MADTNTTCIVLLGLQDQLIEALDNKVVKQSQLRANDHISMHANSSTKKWSYIQSRLHKMCTLTSRDQMVRL